MNFKAFYQGLSKEDRKRFAEIAGTSTGYIEVHLMPRRKIPKPALMESLSDALRAFDASLSKDDLLSFFYETEQMSCQVDQATV